MEQSAIQKIADNYERCKPYMEMFAKAIQQLIDEGAVKPTISLREYEEYMFGFSVTDARKTRGNG